MGRPQQLVGASPIFGQKRGTLKQEQQGGWMEQKHSQRWSSEALKAIDTHLSLLQRAYARNITGVKRLEEQNCGLGADKDAKRLCSPIPVLDRTYVDDVAPYVELNSHIPLPDGWEQFLDLKTGQAYYIDWKTCRRSYIDPRTMIHQSLSRGANSLYPRRRWELHPECIEPGPSDCVSDGCNCTEKVDSDERAEVNSKLVTSAMLEEDWDLMKLRGWLTLSTDNQSKITNEVCSVKACPLPVEGKRDEISPSGSDNLTPLPLFAS